jgi:hypothetical protein
MGLITYKIQLNTMYFVRSIFLLSRIDYSVFLLTLYHISHTYIHRPTSAIKPTQLNPNRQAQQITHAITTTSHLPNLCDQ